MTAASGSRPRLSSVTLIWLRIRARVLTIRSVQEVERGNAHDVYNCVSLSVASVRMRVQSHCAVRLRHYLLWARVGERPDGFHLCDVTQRVQYVKRTSVVMGCLLKKSLPWSLHHGRCLLPFEALQVMGMSRQSCPFAQAVLDGTLTNADVRGFAGNVMHSASVAAAYICGAVQLF